MVSIDELLLIPMCYFALKFSVTLKQCCVSVTLNLLSLLLLPVPYHYFLGMFVFCECIPHRCS